MVRLTDRPDYDHRCVPWTYNNNKLQYPMLCVMFKGLRGSRFPKKKSSIGFTIYGCRGPVDHVTRNS